MSLPDCGTAPRYLENLRVGGGYASSPDGGADLDHAGNAAFDGDVTIGGSLTAKGAISYTNVLRADTAHGGVNRDWSVPLRIFSDEVSTSAAGPTTVTFSSRLVYKSWDFPAATLEVLNASFMLPPDYDGSNLKIRLVWCSQASKGGTSGNVLWRVYMRAYADGAAFALGTTSVDALDSFQGQDKFHLVDLVHAPDNPGPGLPVSINIRRIGDDTSDTFNADAQLMKVLVSYA